MLESKFNVGCRETPGPRSVLPVSPSHQPLEFGKFVGVLAQSSNYLLELAKLYCEPWRISGLIPFSKVALQNAS